MRNIILETKKVKKIGKKLAKRVAQYLEDEDLMTQEEFNELLVIEKTKGLHEAAHCWGSWKHDSYLVGDSK